MRQNQCARWTALALGLFLAVPRPTLGAEDARATRRLALVIGANDGGRERVRLRYATSDALAMTKVLGTLGNVTPADRLLLRDPEIRELREGLARLRGMVESARGSSRRVELVFYYSGHSDEEGLLLRGERLPYGELRGALQALPSDVRIVILDSCASGAFTRQKGGTLHPPFMVDQSSQVTGQVILTSSSADEVSQESDRIGGSFFTHNLVSGLRGAADVTRDGRVTLNEAYQFAFQQTLARTENTQGGTQHPAYAIELAGTGDVVMTDLRGIQAGLVLPATLDGRLYIRDAVGNLVVELEKHPGKPMELGLEAGRYAVLLDRGGQRYRGEVVLAEGRLTELPVNALAALQSEATVPRGGGEMRDWVTIPVSFDMVPGVGSNGLLMTRNVENYVSFGLLGSHSGRLTGFGLTSGVSVVYQDMRGVQLSGLLNVTGGQTRGLQLSGGLNVSGEVPFGIQLAGIANVASGPLGGAQVSGLGNFAPSLRGLQLGVINIGGDVSGAQVGVLNIATRMKGLQLGLLNFAGEMDGVPLGLLSIVRNGQFHLDVWGSETSVANVGVKFGSKHFYSLFAVGTGLASQQRWETMLGLGGRISLGSFFVDLDILGSNVRAYDRWDARNDLLGRVRLSTGYRLLPWLAAFGGASVNGLIPLGNFRDDIGTGPHVDRPLGSTFIRYFPGFFAGVEVL